MSIATKTGDSGETSLFFGKRVAKNSARLESYGTVDELNALLGLCRVHDSSAERKEVLKKVQTFNFILCAELATPEEKQEKLKEKINEAHINFLEELVHKYEVIPGVIGDWAIPGEIISGAYYDYARCVCRRAERIVVTLDQEGEVKNPNLLKFLNRLSDLLWLMERMTEIEADKAESAKLRGNKKTKLGADLD